jgi:hypothetical protein
MDHKTKPSEVYTTTPTNILMKIVKVLVIQLMGKNNGEKMELLHS